MENSKRKEKVISALKEGKIVDDTSFTVFQMIEDLKEEVDEKIEKLQKDESPDAKAERIAAKLAGKFLSLEKGDKGEQGEKGDKGDTGEQGIPGEKGEKGDKGDIGLPGIDGLDGRDGVDGKDGNPASIEEVAQQVLETIVIPEEDAESIVTKINEGESLIDNTKVRGFTDLERIAKLNTSGFNPTMGPSFSDLARLEAKIGTGGGGSGTVGPGTTNEIAYFNAPTTIASLTTATYPSLTELSYVKGVTSAIQTQLDAITSGYVPYTGATTNLNLGAHSYIGTGTANRIGTATTADALADTLLATSATTQKGLVIQGKASQSANLFEVQKSTGANFVSIDNNGVLRVDNGATGTQVAMLRGTVSGSTGFVGSEGSYEFGFGSNSIPRILASAAGNVGINTGNGYTYGTEASLTVRANSTTDNLATTQLNGRIATNKVLVVQGVSSQSANLQEWQSSTGVVLSNIDSNGALTLINGATRDGAWNGAIQVNAGRSGGVQFPSLIFGGQDTTDYSTIMWTNSTSGNSTNSRGAQIYAQPSSATNTDLHFSTNNAVGTSVPTEKLTILGSGNIGIGNTSPGNRLSVFTPTTADSLADVLFAASATTQKGLVIQGKLSQTANLQEWQKSDGTVLSSVSSAGNVLVAGAQATPGLSIVGGTGTGLWGSGNTFTGVASNNYVFAWGPATGFIIYDGTSGGTGYTRLQASAAGVLNFGTSAGGTQATLKFSHANIGTLTTADSLADNYINTTATTQKGLIIQATASQSANLQEWQSSTGSVLAAISKDGTLSASANGAGIGADIGGYIRGQSGFLGPNWYKSTNLISVLGWVDDNVLRFTSGSAANGKFIVKGASSQSADLLQFQKSDATVYTSFSSVGLLNKYNSVATAGWGVPAIYGSGRVTAQTTTNASVATYTVGAADGSFIVSVNVLCTAFTSGSMQVTVAWTDEGNTAQTYTCGFTPSNGDYSGTPTSIGGTGTYVGIPMHIRCKASTAITVATTGTFVLTYNAEGIIQQLA